MKPNQKPSQSWALRASFTVASMVAFSGLAVLVSRAVKMVTSGQGLETYRTFWLVEFNYIGLLVFLVVAVVALVVGAILRLRERGQWRELEGKCGGKH